MLLDGLKKKKEEVKEDKEDESRFGHF